MKAQNKMFKVEKFKYNGVFVSPMKGYTKYKAIFICWTDDPGIAKCSCSDGRIRLIPSCCLIGDKSNLPEQVKTGVFFGTPSHS